MIEVEIVNIAASGDLGREVDIEQIAIDVNIPVANYDPNVNSLTLRFEEDTGKLVFLYTSGAYIIRGGDSYDSLERVRQQFLQLLKDIGIELNEPTFEVKNVVCVADLEREVNLNHVLLELGLESTEYEPEQFPGLVYRPSESPCVLLVFASGKVVITGGDSYEVAEDAFTKLRDQLK